MANKFLSIFSICAILLGVYILVSAIIGTDPSLSAKYHIGCYLTNNTHNHYHQITSTLEKLKQKKQKSRVGLNMYKSLVLGNSDLRQKSVKIARQFQNYIHKVVISGAHQKNNQQFYFQLQNSLNLYEQCKQNIIQNFDQEDCKSNWQEYAKCTSQMDETKYQIKKYIADRQIINSNIKRVLNPQNEDPNKIDIEALLKEIQQKYKRLNEANDKRGRQAKSEFINQKNKIQQRQNNLQELQKEFTNIKIQYNSCFANLRDFNACKNLTSTINSYGYSQTINGIEERIKNKKATLDKMLKLIGQQKGAGMEAIKQLYNKGENQLRQLLRLNIEIQTQKKNSQCGCTEQVQKKLQYSKQKLQKTIQDAKNQIDDISQTIKSLQTTLKSLEIERERLLLEHNQKINQVLSMKTPTGNTKELLQQYKKQLDILNEDILNYDSIFNKLLFKCNQYKDNLSRRFSETDELKKCLLKKDYYEKLKSKGKEILYSDPSNEAAKLKLVKSLKAIQWQKAIQNKNEILKQQIKSNEQSEIPYELINQLFEKTIIESKEQIKSQTIDGNNNNNEKESSEEIKNNYQSEEQANKTDL